MNQTLVFFAVLAACVSSGYAIICYECEEGLNQLCGDPFGGHVRTRLCGSEEVCIKFTTRDVKIGESDIPRGIIRGCGPQSICSNEPSQYRDRCHTCSSNRCNSAVAIIPSFTTVIVIYIVKLIVL